MKAWIVPALALAAASYPIESPAQSGSAPQQRLCPNGKYVYGTGCYLAPDGTYTGYPAQMAPNGTYVPGTPRLAPNGQYIGGQQGQRTILCPNGTYVVGTRCRLMPDGSYRGE